MRTSAARRRAVVGVLVAALALAAGCAVPQAPAATPGTGAASAPADPGTSPAASASPAPPRPRHGLARAAVDAAQAEAESGTQLGVAVLDRATGELAVGERGDEPFYTASLSKLVVAVDVLDRRRFDGLTVSDADLALLRRALSLSDDSAMSALWERFDGAGAAQRVSVRVGLQDTSAPKRFGQWGEMEVPPSDYVRLWGYVLDKMPTADRDLLVGDMAAAPPTAKDGFDQAFGLLSQDIRDDDETVAKQGWMCCFSGQYYLHSAGTVGADKRFVVALMTREPRARGWAGAREDVTGIAGSAVGPLTG
jgi:hypothetical protein